MNVDTVHEEQYKGLTIKIMQDDCTDSPDNWGNTDLFLVGYHRNFTVNHNSKIDVDLARCIANKGRYDDNSPCAEAKDYLKQYYIFGLEAYIHSGVHLSLSQQGNYPDRQWDVSQLGLVFVQKSCWKTRKRAELAAKSLIDEWNNYLSGNVYGFLIENEDGDELDSCWGFYGDYNKYCLLDARSAADHLAKAEKKKKQELRQLAIQTVS